jgi:uncharacterized protein YciI
MKHFVVELTYTASLEAIDAAVGGHRAFLQTGYDAGILLLSGPQASRTGGIILGRAGSQEEMERFLSADPFQQRGLATYRFIEFNPVRRQAFLTEWLDGAI